MLGVYLVKGRVEKKKKKGIGWVWVGREVCGGEFGVLILLGCGGKRKDSYIGFNFDGLCDR